MPWANRMLFIAGAGVATLAAGAVARKLFAGWLQSRKPNEDCRLVETNCVLIVLSKIENDVLKDLVKNFCGVVVPDLASALPSFEGKTVYLCGDLSKSSGLSLEAAKRVFAVKDLTHGDADWPTVGVGRLPILVHGVGVLYRQFFEPGVDHFSKIRAQHAFQTLTESTKPGTAHRTGIYLTPVEEDGDDVHFRLLRCSTNLSGPTANFGAHDHQIVSALNEEASCMLQNPAPLNHVLAQIYLNSPAAPGHKETKAKIKAHADKTKDMPRNGLMAFCTFYDNTHRLKPLDKDPFDMGYRGTSALTKLHFRLKDTVRARQPAGGGGGGGGGGELAAQFSVTLYPDSVFLMPLSTNRLYTHEIRPAPLNAALLPTRMGYVVRCSDAEAVFRNGRTLLKSNGALRELGPATEEGMAELRKKYAEENLSDQVVRYGPTLFSMNRGDYWRPLLRSEFRVLSLPTAAGTNPFHELMASVRFEETGKGRQGAVLVRCEEARGTPIVRTTTQYELPAQPFQSVHERLADQIQTLAGLDVTFNNCLIENYTNLYSTMGFHSDQALDLQDGTHIAVFSCYQDPDSPGPPRKLVIESKERGGGDFEIPLTHNSVVVWPLDTNRRFRHKIVLDHASTSLPNRWLGLTLRTSKTFVRTRVLGSAEQLETVAELETGGELRLAGAGERKEFYKLRGRENAELTFEYPPLPYTISPSDLLPPAALHPTGTSGAP